MSAPYLTALMAASLELKPTDRVLEIGTGSGYEAAILSKIAAEVYTVERVGSLADSARRRLADLGYRVSVLEGDGKLGWRAHAPYDAIVVTASGPLAPAAPLSSWQSEAVSSCRSSRSWAHNVCAGSLEQGRTTTTLKTARMCR